MNEWRPRTFLPQDLARSLQSLSDDEFQLLFAETKNEAKRRSKATHIEHPFELGASTKTSREKPEDVAEELPSKNTTTSLKRGQMNAVRAAFKLV